VIDHRIAFGPAEKCAVRHIVHGAVDIFACLGQWFLAVVRRVCRGPAAASWPP